MHTYRKAEKMEDTGEKRRHTEGVKKIGLRNRSRTRVRRKKIIRIYRFLVREKSEQER